MQIDLSRKNRDQKKKKSKFLQKDQQQGQNLPRLTKKEIKIKKTQITSNSTYDTSVTFVPKPNQKKKKGKKFTHQYLL